MGARNYVVDFPTLWIVPAWQERHCIIPDGFRKGTAWRHYDWQLWVTANHYRVQPGVEPFDAEGYPTRAAAFHNRRSLVVAAQKTGKGPFAAVMVCAEAVGPVLFCGWAEGGEVYRCADHGCYCGWSYTYEPGEPMGMPWPTPLIQLLATSEDQVDNVYRPLQAMARGPHLSALMRVGEQFIRLPNDGRIDVVTSSAQSRLGNPITFCLQDETQLYTDTNKLRKVAETMRRGLAGMGGRAMETTNCWDPAEQSVAQRTFEAQASDVFKFYEQPPTDLRYSLKADRRKIHAFNYAGSPHVNLDAIDAEAAEIAETDPVQAERFYGNRIVAGRGSWLPDGLWTGPDEWLPAPDGGESICLGFDGSDVSDWTCISAETRDGLSFTPRYGPDRRPTIWNPAEWGGRIPRDQVDLALAEIFDTYNVERMYCDPPRWETDVERWALEHGEDHVISWATYRPKQMHEALERFVADLTEGRIEHDGCPLTNLAIGNARKVAKGADRYILAKPSPSQKIDPAMTRVLAHEAASDARAAGWADDGPSIFFLA